MWLGFLSSLAAGLATAVGALPVLIGRRIAPRANDALLGFVVGVMIAALFFLANHSGSGGRQGHFFRLQWLAAVVVTSGILIGAAWIAVLNDVVPHEHFKQGREGPQAEVGRIWLFVFAITIHNLPEGLAVSVGFAGGHYSAGASLAMGIGLQNIPEGLAVALALLSIGYDRIKAFAIAGLTGLVESVTGLAGAYAVSVSQHLLPWAMAFAAGAMIFVMSHEIIPETHRHGAHRPATFGLMIGLAIMLLLDVSL